MFEEFTERQEEIIKVSLKLISEKGIQGLTIKNISNKIGTVESAIYRHFAGKKQIIHAIFDILKKNSLPENYIENENTLYQIEKTLKKHLQTFASFPVLVAVFFSEDLFQADDILSEKTKEMSKNSLNRMREIIKHGQTKGELRSDINSEHLTSVISGTFKVFVKQWKMSNYSFDLLKKGNELIDALKELIKPCSC
jgi:AcrR family transcriptional regulator